MTVYVLGSYGPRLNIYGVFSSVETAVAYLRTFGDEEDYEGLAEDEYDEDAFYIEEFELDA